MRTKETRTIYKVQAHLTPCDYQNLEKYCAKKKKKISAVVRDFIKICLDK